SGGAAAGSGGRVHPGLIRLRPGRAAALPPQRDCPRGSPDAYLRADLLLADDRAARRVAAERGLATTGTLGLLERAAEKRMIDFARVIDQLRATDFAISRALMDAALNRLNQKRD
ncbi:MAG: DUF3368 domain-containing protein, partial [Phycisphaerae bacterium]